jgi:hypothetical protein
MDHCTLLCPCKGTQLRTLTPAGASGLCALCLVCLLATFVVLGSDEAVHGLGALAWITALSFESDALIQGRPDDIDSAMHTVGGRAQTGRAGHGLVKLT